MSALYRVSIDHPADIASVGDRMRSLALRTGFPEFRATRLGVIARELASMLERGARVWIDVRGSTAPSALTVELDPCPDPRRATAWAESWADRVELDGDRLSVAFTLPDSAFKPDSDWLRATTIWLAEQTPAELQQELSRTNQELRVVLDNLRRQARSETRKARALASANAELEEMHAREFQLARVDPVSRLPSRVHFESCLTDQIEQSRRKNTSFALLYIDLDLFKEINDTFGHSAGDLTLATIGERMIGALRESDLVGRLGGDEFGIILRNMSDPYDAGKVAELLIESIREPIELAEGTGRVDASIGIALYPTDGEDAESLTSSADAAMYRVKHSGRGSYAFHTPRSDVAVPTAQSR